MHQPRRRQSRAFWPMMALFTLLVIVWVSQTVPPPASGDPHDADLARAHQTGRAIGDAIADLFTTRP